MDSDAKTALTRDEALEKLRALVGGDPEADHVEADYVLLDLIGDPEIRDAWEAIDKWFA